MPTCGRHKPGDFQFEHVFDHSGKMTAVREALLTPYREGAGIVIQ
jgi:hypothetical protein